MSRVRNRNSGFVSGYFKAWGGGSLPIVATRSRYNLRETVTDEVAPGDNHPFFVSRQEVEGGRVTGVSSGSYKPGVGCYGNYTVSESNGATSFASHAFTGSPTNGDLAALLLARTNPSRPVVDLPIFVYELRELPELFKLAGNSLLKKAANANLAYQFGWRPLIGDLSKLLDFSDQFAKREKELRHLFKSGLRRTRHLFDGNGSTIPTLLASDANTSLFTVNHYRSSITTEKVWGSCRWVPSGLPPRSDDKMRSLARKAVLGLTIDPATAWEAIPFSWLADWCSSMGNYLSAQRNIVGAMPTEIIIMRHKVTEHTWKLNYIQPPYECEDVSAVYETKERAPASATVSAHLPFLSLRQLSILGSIGVKKYRAPRI